MIRFACIYFLLFAFPFPLSALLALVCTPVALIAQLAGSPMPMLSQIENVVHMAKEGIFGLITVPIGRVLGVEVLTQPTGSGDGAHHYLSVAIIAVLSLLVAAVWQWRRRSAFPARAGRWLHAGARWWLAAVMLSYGSIKFFGSQFWEARPHELMSSLGDMSPMHLAWTFLGHSPSYQRIMGLAELLPAILLFHRKTALPGLLMLVGVLANIFAMNLFFDIPVKLHSLHYLLTALLLLLPHWPRLRGFLWGEREIPSVDLLIEPKRVSKRTWDRLTATFAVGVVLCTALSCWMKRTQMDAMRKPSVYAGLWKVQSVMRDSRPWRANDLRGYAQLAIDDLGRLTLVDHLGEKTTFRIEDDPASDAVVLHYPFLRRGPNAKGEAPTSDAWKVNLGSATTQVPNSEPTSFQDRNIKRTVTAPHMKLSGHWKGHHYEISAIRPPLPIDQPFRWVQAAPFQH